MKLKEGFILRTIAGETVVIPSNQNLNLNMMITLNETGKFLWEQLKKETSESELVEALLCTYEVEEKDAVRCVAAFVEKVKKYGFLA